MSAYYTRWCDVHGEWPIYIDELLCPKCVEPELIETQQLKLRTEVMKQTLDDMEKELDDKKKLLADWAEHEDLAPHKGCSCKMCITLESADSMKSAWNAACGELTNLKSAFARLREDRDRLAGYECENHAHGRSEE